MQRKDFDYAIGESYQVNLAEGQQVKLVLQKIESLDPPPENAPEWVRREPFLLVFEGPSEKPLPSGTLHLKGPQGEEHYLALNAESHADGYSTKGIHYCAVIN